MNKIKIANAPCSWGALEFDLAAATPGHLQVLQEIAETGYVGTELGDWGFMPTDPDELRQVIERFHLELIGAFVPVALAERQWHEQGVDNALRVANLMAQAGYPDAYIVLADDNGTVPERTMHAGRVTPEMGLEEQRWKTFAKGAMQVAQAVKDEHGMRTVFHHHCGGYVETPDELAMLMTLTDPQLLGLCFDTGHYAFGGGNSLAAVKKYRDRIWHVHFKDYDPHMGQLSKTNQWDYFESVKQGVFCELGKGNVAFDTVLHELTESGYQGWVVVEQDVLPGMGTPKECARNNRIYLEQLGL
ncbi:TIM barrel protein [Parapedobacter tibetensis]|uniref:TIM barrel protein n=1 Tax=Parapedobacter tibetensis TaxID=2972951 RepID=UPI00214DEF0F|nr:TIM barrel protein [Parapedobacter tibetensis]